MWRTDITDQILDSVVEDLFSTLPLIGRSINKKLLKTALAGIREDISPVHFEIMMTMEETGTLHATEIGEKLQIPKPRMTQLIDKLVNLGMVKRHRNTKDRRTINIMLSTKGKDFLKEHQKMIRDSMKMTLSCLNAGELEDLSSSLKKLREIFSKLQ